MEDSNLKALLDNVELIVQHRDAILADPRMSHALVPITNGTAISGPCRQARLGTYLEWWAQGGEHVRTDHQGLSWYVYRLAGSGLSNGNHCLEVCQDGRRGITYIRHFMQNFYAFIDINRKYQTEVDDAYTIEQVVALLQR